MSFKAIISVGGKNFDLIFCESWLDQKLDKSGRPISGVIGGQIKIIMDGTEDDTFESWVTDPNKKQDGVITFYHIDQNSKFKEIEFKGAYLTKMNHSFIVEDDIANIFHSEVASYAEFIGYDDFKLIKGVQRTTGISFVIFCTLSAEKIKIDGVEHDNKW
jgi:Hemolysin coregulated protein Hcp (TssD)